MDRYCLTVLVYNAIYITVSDFGEDSILLYVPKYLAQVRPCQVTRSQATRYLSLLHQQYLLGIASFQKKKVRDHVQKISKTRHPDPNFFLLV